MNNNYHTQLDKSQTQDVDPSHTAVLQQMQNFQGTPIGMPQRDAHLSQGTSISTGMPKAQDNIQRNPQLMQMLLAQQLTHQQQAQQAQHLFQQAQAQVLAQSQAQAQAHTQPPDEIELSETKSETKAKGIDPRLQRVTEHFQQMVQNGTANPPTQPQPAPVAQVQPPAPVQPPAAPRPAAQPTQTQAAPAPQQRRSTAPAPSSAAPAPAAPIAQPPAKKSGALLNYLIIPIVILIVVMAILHPKTAPIFDKFLPPASSLTGMLARSGAVVVAYILTRFIGGFVF